MNERFLNKLNNDFENGKPWRQRHPLKVSEFIRIIIIFLRGLHYLLVHFAASKNSAALQEELESLFVSFSENILLEVEQTKNEMNSKASAIEEVR